MDSYTLDSSDTVSVLRIEIPRAVADALETGKVSMGATIGMKGCDLWVQFMDPKTYHIVYSLDDAVRELEGSGNVTAKGKELAPPDTPPQSPEMGRLRELEREMESLRSGFEAGPEVIRIPHHEALEAVASRNLNKHRVNGVLNFYSTKSLVKQDFKRTSVFDFVARATVVAGEIGSARAVSRIQCDETLRIPGCRDLHEWWRKASNVRRARLLMNNKVCDVNTVDTSILRRTGCPFGNAGFSEQDSD